MCHDSGITEAARTFPVKREAPQPLSCQDPKKEGSSKLGSEIETYLSHPTFAVFCLYGYRRGQVALGRVFLDEVSDISFFPYERRFGWVHTRWGSQHCRGCEQILLPRIASSRVWLEEEGQTSRVFLV